MPVLLNEEILTCLLAHSGHGVGNVDPSSVEILIIGNESGTGGYKNDVQGYIRDQLNPENNHISSASEQPVKIRSRFLQFIKRLSLYSNDKDIKWFGLKSELGHDWNQIVEHWCGNNVHLVDIRPLPRPNETWWDYDSSIIKQDYLKAFNAFDENYLAPYGDWVKRRKTALFDQLNSYPNLKYIIAPGRVDMKMKFITQWFGLQQPFERIVIPKSNKPNEVNCFYRYSLGPNTHSLRNNHSIQIGICAFFDDYSGIGVEGLKHLAMDVLSF